MLKSNSNPQIDTSPEIRRIALYGRFRTTKDQNPVQLRELREYAGRRGWQVARLCSEELSWAEVYRHTGLSKAPQRAAQSISEAVFSAAAAESCLEVR